MRRTKTKPAPRIQKPRRPRTLTVRDIMSTDVVVLDSEVTLRDAVTLLATRHITGAPVVAAQTLVGTLSANDVLAFQADTPGVPTERSGHPERNGSLAENREDEWAQELEAPSGYFTELWEDAGADVAERFAQLSGPEWDVLAEHTVAEAMSRGVRSVSPATSVHEAAAYMLKERIHRAVVLDRGSLVGIVTASDVMRAVAERRV